MSTLGGLLAFAGTVCDLIHVIAAHWHFGQHLSQTLIPGQKFRTQHTIPLCMTMKVDRDHENNVLMLIMTAAMVIAVAFWG